MFDVGFSELLVIAVVALLVLGPERLPRAARFAGLWVRRARAQWHTVRNELEQELAADDLRRSLEEANALVRDTGRDLVRGAGDVPGDDTPRPEPGEPTGEAPDERR
jgi:sec-independent protein translocase protein TatB